VIDLHAHIVPGVDDGVATVEEALELARRAAAEGVTMIAATPHVRDDYPTTSEQMEAGVGHLRGELRQAGVAVELLPGSEIALDRLGRLGKEELLRFSLAQSRRYLLVEFPYSGWPLTLERSLWAIEAAGLVPILAHPERNREVQERPDRLAPLVGAGNARADNGRVTRRTPRAVDAANCANIARERRRARACERRARPAAP
jgi:protein-tyrosine phosphatase